MSDIYLDPATNDIAIVNGEFRLCKTKDELTRQKIYINLNMNKGNWGYNVKAGVPWIKNDYNNVQLVGKTPIGIVDSYIKQAVLSREGVIGISTYESEIDQSTRVMVSTIKAITEEGEIELVYNVEI